MTDDGYISELLKGVAAHLAGGTYGDAALATYPIPTDGTPAGPRPVYFQMRPDLPDECIVVTALTPVIGPNNGVVTPVNITVRGPRDGKMLDAWDLAEAVARRLEGPNGRPLVHVSLGRVRVGRVRRESLGVLPADTEKRWRSSQTHQFRGKRFLVT